MKRIIAPIRTAPRGYGCVARAHFTPTAWYMLPDFDRDGFYRAKPPFRTFSLSSFWA